MPKRGTMIQRPYDSKRWRITENGGRPEKSARLRPAPNPGAAPPSKAHPSTPAVSRNRMPNDRIWGGS